MKYLYVVFLSIFLIVCDSCVSQGDTRKNNKYDIRNPDIKINESDSIINLRDSIYILSKYDKKKELLYKGYYINGELNGPIDFYIDGKKFAYGLMKRNKPSGLFRFVDGKGGIDSIRIYNDEGSVQDVDLNLFKFDKVTLSSVTKNYQIDRPLGWLEVVDTISEKQLDCLIHPVRIFSSLQ